MTTKSTKADPLKAVLDTVQEEDCLKGIKRLPDTCVDLLISDPPYNIGREYDAHDDNMESGAYLRWCRRWLDQCARLLKPTGSLWLCSSEEHVAELKVIAEGKYGLVLSGDDGDVQLRRSGNLLKPRHHIIWHFSFGINSPKKLGRSHTHILHFVRSLKKHKWNPDAVRVPSARQTVYNDKRANPAGKLPDDTWILRPQEPGAGLKPDHDVWHFSRVCGTFREKRETDNQMPEQLLGRILRLCTDEGDLVLDPFAGSGTTLAVARKLNRRFIGFEKSPGYVAQIKLRLDSCKAGDKLDGKGDLDAPVCRQTGKDKAQ